MRLKPGVMNTIPISRVAIILFAIVIGVFGIYHFVDPENLAIQVPSFLSNARLWVYLVGALLILASVSLILNVQVKLVSYVLAVLMVSFAIFIHFRGYLDLASKEMQAVSFMNMLKDLGLACCVLYIGATARPKHAVVKETIMHEEMAVSA